MFGQTFDYQDLAVIGVLIVLEGVLSIDNALVLGILAKRLPKFLQAKALTYGLIGAFVFRILAIAAAGFLLRWSFPKLLGGAYLIWVAVKHFLFETPADDTLHPTVGSGPAPTDADLTPPRVGHLVDFAHTTSTHTYAFWSTVVVIELTDIAFAVDSILAAVGTVPGREKLWLVVTGGMLGVILMRYAATVFIRLLEKFPRFELTAYLLVIVIGLKLVLDYAFNRDGHHRLDFHSPTTAAFWTFWGVMALCFASGFLPARQAPGQADHS